MSTMLQNKTCLGKKMAEEHRKWKLMLAQRGAEDLLFKIFYLNADMLF